MKKILTIILCLLLCLSLFSCKKGNDTDTEEQITTTTDTFKHKGGGNKSNKITPKERAKMMYEAILNNESSFTYIPVSESTPQEKYIQDVFVYNEKDTFSQAVVDMDEDGIEEIILTLKSSYYAEKIIFHYENGSVYGYALQKNAIYSVYSNGIVGWSNNNEFGYESGYSQILFNGEKLKIKEIIRYADDVYYIDGQIVTYDQYYEYLSDIWKDEIEFSPVEIDSWGIGKAIKLASEYWEIEQGSFDEETGYRYRLKGQKEGVCYRVCLYWFVKNSYYEHLECVLVDIETGEISIPEYPDAKG